MSIAIEQWRASAIQQLSADQQARTPGLAAADALPAAAIDVDCLLCHVLNCQRSYLFTWGDRLLSASQNDDLKSLLQQRLNGHPIAYLTGQREFWSLTLATDSSTLIPRADTETLVEQALSIAFHQAQVRCLDLGTGTGAIALALASEKPQWLVSAVDQSHAAVTLARQNAANNRLAVTIFQSNWFSQVDGQFDLIVSNPPYIDASDPHLQQGDVQFEPRSALVAERQGYADIEEIIDHAPRFLSSSGWLMFEHGYQQAQGVAQRLQQRGFQQVRSVSDLAGQPRVTMGQWPHETDMKASELTHGASTDNREDGV